MRSAGMRAGDFPGRGGLAKRGLGAGMAGQFAGRGGRVAGLAGALLSPCR